MNQNRNTEAELLETIIKGIEDKKGIDIISMDLSEIPGAICQTFVICSGTSSTHAEAIADSVVDEVRKTLCIKPLHVEGYANKEWILIDYVDIIVHVFQPDIRKFYALEELWADVPITHFEPQV